MDTGMLSRYSRHLLLPGIERDGQESIMRTHVLIIGLGGLGAIAAHYLWSAGIGQLSLVDGDHIETHNLPRQVLYHEADIGQNKAKAAYKRLQEHHPRTGLIAHDFFIDSPEPLRALIKTHDYILDCTDRFETRYLLNHICREQQAILISAGIKHYQAYLSCFDFRDPKSPCYGCLFPEALAAEAHSNCQRSGVLSTAVGSVGLLQAGEVLKRAAGEIHQSFLLSMDFKEMQFRRYSTERDPECPHCGLPNI